MRLGPARLARPARSACAAVSVLTATIAFVVASARPAESAVVYQISLTPSVPVVNEPVAVVVHTFTADDSAADFRGDPLNLERFLWRFQAQSADGEVIAIRLTQGRDGHEWVGRVVFSAAGRWSVGLAPEHRVVAPDSDGSAPADGSLMTVTVRSGRALPSTGISGVGPIALAAILLFLGLGAIAVAHWMPR